MTNKNSPPTDRPSRNLAKALAAVLVILTSADLVLGSRAWFNERQKCLAAERDSAVLATLQEITQTHLLLCRIDNGKREEVTQALNFKLSNDIRSLDSSVASVDDDTRELARTVCQAVARAATKRSEHHPAPVTSTGSNGANPCQLPHVGQPNPAPRMAQNN